MVGRAREDLVNLGEGLAELLLVEAHEGELVEGLGLQGAVLSVRETLEAARGLVEAAGQAVHLGHANLRIGLRRRALELLGRGHALEERPRLGELGHRLVRRTPQESGVLGEAGGVEVAE